MYMYICIYVYVCVCRSLRGMISLLQEFLLNDGRLFSRKASNEVSCQMAKNSDKTKDVPLKSQCHFKACLDTSLELSQGGNIAKSSRE